MDEVAWINIQKVSNLILDVNLYIADVHAKKMTFVHSVDIRGNTDESWMRSMDYLIETPLLPNKGEQTNRSPTALAMCRLSRPLAPAWRRRPL